MRIVALVVLLLCAGCDGSVDGRQKAIAPDLPVTFDGARVTNSGARVEHGERLTRVLGCRGCHGAELQGDYWDNDHEGHGVLWASNLTRSIPTMSDEQLRSLLISGVHPKRRDMWIMPSEIFQRLEENDLAALMAYLRSLPPAGKPSPDPAPGPRAIAEVKSGKLRPAATLVREWTDKLPSDLGPDHRLARYISSLTCAECHGPDLKGVKGDTPDLVVASSYSRAEFERLITEGVPTGNRKLKPLMQSVAKSRYSQLTPNERNALYAYLRKLAEQPSN